MTNRDRQLVPWMLLGLPLGLAVSVAAGLLLWTVGDSRGERPAEQRKAGLERAPGKVEQRLRDYVVTLSERVGERSAAKPEGARAAALFVESTLGVHNIGYPVRRREFDAGGQTWSNLEAVLPGKDRTGGEIVIGAHYDTVEGSPGADDNASGVAVLLILAERFAGRSQERTIRWVAFCNEEPPWFQSENMGSVRYAAELKREGVPVAAMISLESLGYFRDEPGSQKYPEPLAKLYPDTGNFLAVVSDVANQRLVEFAWKALRETGLLPTEKGAFPESLPGVGWSDHWGFWKSDFPGIMLTDTAPYRNPHYHRETDLPGTLDYVRLGKVVDAVERLILRLSNGPRQDW